MSNEVRDREAPHCGICGNDFEAWERGVTLMDGDEHLFMAHDRCAEPAAPDPRDLWVAELRGRADGYRAAIMSAVEDWERRDELGALDTLRAALTTDRPEAGGEPERP